MSKSRIVAAALALCAGVVAGPVAVAAADSERTVQFSAFNGPFTTVYEPCGAVETLTITEHGTEYFDENGDSLRLRVHYFYDSVVTGPTGKSISMNSHQMGVFTPAGINTLTGQGPNVRAPGLGLIYQDVGRLVFDISNPPEAETLFASAKSVSFAAFDPDKLAAAICTAVG